MKSRFFALVALFTAVSTALLSCAAHSGGDQYLSDEDCERLNVVPDSCLIDTLGIVGTIFPKNYTFEEDSSNSGPYSTWTPTKADVLAAEEILRRFIKGQHRCIDEGYNTYYRQYAGRGQYNNCVLIHGIRMSREKTVCGKRSFWINIYDTGCSIFDATIDIRLGTCDIVFPSPDEVQ